MHACLHIHNVHTIEGPWYRGKGEGGDIIGDQLGRKILFWVQVIHVQIFEVQVPALRAIGLQANTKQSLYHLKVF